MVALLAVLTGGPPAHAQERFVATVDPPQVSVGTTKELVFRLDMETGDRARRFQVRVTPNWSFGSDHDRREGDPIGALDPPRLAGDATEEGSTRMFGLPTCGTAREAHGAEGGVQTVAVHMAAHARATVTARFFVSASAPWPTTDYRAKFEILPRQANPVDAMARPDDGPIEPRVVMPQPIAVDGKRGVRIFLHTEPPSAARGSEANLPGIAAGTRIAIRGEVDPPSPDLWVQLRYEGPDTVDGELRLIETVQPDSSGRFGAAWRPRQPGRYQLWAVYESDRPDLADDHSCPRGFRLTGEPAPEEPAAAQVRMRHRHIRVAGSTLRVRLGCSGAVGAICTGALAVRSRTLRYRARRSYAIRAGSTRIVRLPIGKAPRRRLRGRDPARAIITLRPNAGRSIAVVARISG